VGIKSDPRFASQSVHITHGGAVVIDEDGFQTFSESTADHDKTTPDAHGGGEGGANTTRALKAR
jgi:hypothetical protein